MNILPLLQKKGLLTAQQVAEIVREVEEGTAIEAALAKRTISPETILATLSEAYGIPSRTLPQAAIPAKVLEYVSQDSAEHYEFVPIGIADSVLEVGIVDPDNIEALDALQFISTRIGMPYKLFLITKADFDRVLVEYKNLSGEVDEALTELGGGGVVDLGEDKPDESKEELNETAIKADAPVTKIVTTILRYAVDGGASDIHVEPGPDKTRVRFRMDGDLHTSLQLPSKVHSAVVARIKILSQLRLDEKRKPQDGRFSATVEGRRIDFRVSTFPTQFGEKVVMRILDRSKAVETIESIGFSEKDLVAIREIIKAPYGIILLSGPTGSGKSTTLFTMLSALDRETSNVVSVEDPVEYEIPEVSQSQVRPEIGYTFASGLRSILRQDPDIIMVGEIRDKETAQLAVQAALTGHLVFSTIHTNTAAGVIPRLIDMGVDPYLIAPTLIASVGQRLVRKLCPGAEEPMPVTESIKIMLDKEFSDLPQEFHKDLPPFTQFYTAKPTPDCPNGTRGRMGVFEIMRMNKDLEHVLLTNPIEESIYAAARKNGMITMREDAIMKALAGKIPFEEINTLGGDAISDEPKADV